MTFKRVTFPILWSLIGLSLFAVIDISAQDYTTMNLPDGAIARLGKGQINGVAFSPRGDILVVATFAGHTADVRFVSFLPDGHALASASIDGTFLLWDTSRIEN